MVFENKNYNLIVLLGVFVTSVVVYWAYANDISFGNLYIGLFLLAVGLLFFMMVFIKEDDKKGYLAKLKFPFATDTPIASAMMVLGWVSFLIVQFFGMFANFSVVNVMVPLTAGFINSVVQLSASQLSLSLSNGMGLFVTGQVAAFLEELVFGFALVVVLYILVSYIIQELTGKKSHHLTMIISLVLTSIAFASMHSFNATYGQFVFTNFSTWTPYIKAASFRFFMNVLIYYTGATLSATIGFHQANNYFWFYKVYGGAAFKSALFSFTGILSMLFFGFIIWILINKIPSLNKAVAMIFKGARGVKS